MRMTRNKQRILDEIVGFHESNGRYPTYQEVADSLGYRSISAICQHVGDLEDMGYVERGYLEGVVWATGSPDSQRIRDLLDTLEQIRDTTECARTRVLAATALEDV